MKEKINENLLCVLTFKKDSNVVELSYVDIINPLQKELNALESLKKSQADLNQYVHFLENSPNLKLLNGEHKYCVYLDKPYQGVSFNLSDLIKSVKERIVALKSIDSAERVQKSIDETIILANKLRILTF